MVKSEPAGSYHRFPYPITEEDWNKRILPYIESQVFIHKLVLRTMPVFTPELGTFFLKKADTPAYRNELKGYHIYFTQGNVKDSIVPPTYKSIHRAKELARNLSLVHGLKTAIKQIINVEGTGHEYQLIKCE